jgi:hypothetical protein
MYARNVDFWTALQEAAKWCGQPQNERNGAAIGSSTAQTPLVRRGASKPPIDWQQCVNAIQDEHLEQLARLQMAPGTILISTAFWSANPQRVGRERAGTISPI